MPLPASGVITMGDVNTELGLSPTVSISLNDTIVRNLFVKPTGAISLNDGHGKSSVLPIEDVFSAYTYTGNGSTQTITNGIDLAGKGGLVWIKNRIAAGYSHSFYDTTRLGTVLSSNTTIASVNTNSRELTSFNANGFSLSTNWQTQPNNNGETYVSWTFRKAPKFFDIVTYTGNGTAGRTIAHSLGIAPGMLIVKGTSAGTAGYAWMVYHRSFISAAYRMKLNEIYTENPDNGMWNSTAPTDSVFTVGSDGSVNASGETYVAYLFAHDTGVDGLIQCGSFTQLFTDVDITLGWEPQFVLTKATDQSYTDWLITDNSRGFTADAKIARLWANLAEAEANSSEAIAPTATGFKIKGTSSGGIIGIGYSGIYMAIRRGPMKKPTVGTQVYNAIARTGTDADAVITGVGFPPDLLIGQYRNYSKLNNWFDRTRGDMVTIASTSLPGAEQSDYDSLTSFDMNGITVGVDTYAYGVNNSISPLINWFFRRMPGVFDIVADAGTDATHTVSHNLTVPPELILRKSRTAGWDWKVFAFDPTKLLLLSTTSPYITSSAMWNDTAPTSSVFTLGTGYDNSNVSGFSYINYLFATLAGVSKVGSYTGNGSSQTINCGFTTGARFILIKRTSAAGGWFVFDSVRGIVAGNDPFLTLNSTATEVSTQDCVDPESTGFIVVEDNGTTALNTSGVTYLYLAFS